MSEQLPYNDEQWDDVPLPSSETSWQKMELLLEKERRRVVPFWFWRYAAPGLLVIGLGIGGWLWFGSANESEQLPRAEKKKPNDHKEEGRKDVVTSSAERKNQAVPNIVPGDQNSIITADESKHPDVFLQKSSTQNNNIIVGNKQLKTAANKKTKVKSPRQGNNSSDSETGKESVVENNSQVQITASGKKNSIDSIQLGSKVKKDSIKTKDSAKTIISPPVVSNNDKKEEKKKKSSFVWSAGVGLQQPIAVSGQQSSSYNYNGKESALGDHIPSVYLRLQKDKWFAQAEFQYSVPQPVEQFSFSQKTTYNVASLSINIERFTIQKLYYHQLPISINYYLLPNLSVGAGGVYNILAGAVTEQELISKNVLTGSETSTKNLAPVKGFKDSFLYKTTAGILLQTDYHWKRFSLGLRFTQNLQPFIKYTKPDGAILEEKTQALQAIVRFRLWSSK